MKLDYKPVPEKTPRLHRRFAQYRHLHGLALLIGAVFLIALLLETGDSQATLVKIERAPGSEQAEIARLAELDLPAVSAPLYETVALMLPDKLRNREKESSLVDALTDVMKSSEYKDDIQWTSLKVKKGYNLALLAKDAGIRPADIYFLMRAGDETEILKTLYPGETVKINLMPEGQLNALQFDRDLQRLSVHRQNSVDQSVPVFEATMIERPLDVRVAHATGTIYSSLFEAAKTAGLSDQLTMQLAYIFGWDIDFTMDVQRGDRFTVVYEEYYRDGIEEGVGEIIAAEFMNNGNSKRAVRYTDPGGHTDYYSPEGGSLRKAFLRNPVDFMRISSRFNLKRKHPILHRVRAHNGVDYSAKTGTPIKAAGEGKVTFRGAKGGYGNTIIVQHGQKYSTLYAHMSKFSSSVKQGSRVKQGQIIGYVGKTGLATGSHLHYEFRVDGVHRNPLTVQHPSAQPIADSYKADFQAATQILLAQLDVLGQTYFVAQK